MSSGGRASRDKGARAERAIVRMLQERGLAAERVPLSGSMRGRFGGDISMPALGCDLRGEAKVRGHGFTRLYDWLDGRDFLALRADRRPLLVVTTLELAARIVMIAERAKGDARRIGELELALGNIQNKTVPNGLEPDSYARAVLAQNEERHENHHCGSAAR